MVSTISAFYDYQTVLMAGALTAAVVVSLTIYAIFTKTDFTMCGGLLFILLAVMFVGSILAIFIKNRVVNLVLSIFGVILFGIYLIYDTQLVIGKNSRKYSIDDYIIAALNLYIDIIQIFLYILSILGNSQN